MNLLNSSLCEILEKNDPVAKQKFLDKLSARMSEADGEGHVYGYIPRECSFRRTNFRMKLGRTQKYNPEDRVAEWGGKLVFSVRTPCNRKLERLVHLIFDKWHIDVFNEQTQKNEIEWFHFRENVPVSTIANMLNDIMLSMHMDDENGAESNVPVVTYVASDVTFARFPPQLSPASGQVNINTATHGELMTLTGIADKLATRIIDYRKSQMFHTIEDIKRVPYIKDGVFNKCKHQICV